MQTKQKCDLAALMSKSYERFYGIPSNGREEFPLGLYGFFVILYSYHLQGWKMRRTMAESRFLPARHSATGKKYLDEAARRGYITFAIDPEDRRTQLMLPTAKLVDLVDGDLREETSQLLKILGVAQ